MIGGGFGGAILALVEAAQAGDVARAVVGEYQARTRTGRALAHRRPVGGRITPAQPVRLR